jgi:predicted phage-related endonuclease
MKVHNVKQGSDSWAQLRLNHFTASEAPAMLGVSSKTTRDELLRIKHTGNEKEYSEWVKNVLFADGHKYEAKAREIIESRLNRDLYPVTCTDGIYLASCDGLTLNEKIAFEHKSWNQQLAFQVENGDLPDEYMAQCQQILMVTRAEKLIFVCSDGTETRIEAMEVLPDLGWFRRIKDGWRRFEIDLKNYQPRTIEEKPEPDAIMQLPALTVQIKGEVTTSNLPEFKRAAETFIANIKTDLQTDEDFVNAESTVKFCAETEKKIELAKDAAIAQTASIDELMRAMDHIKESLRKKRLTLEKLVKTQKEEIKNFIIDCAFMKALDHARELSNEIKLVAFRQIAEPLINKRDFNQAAKNKRTLASLHNAIDTHLANVKISLDSAAKGVRKNIDYLSGLTDAQRAQFHDLQHIVTKDFEDFSLLVDSRVMEYDKRIKEETERKLQAEKQRIEAENLARQNAELDKIIGKTDELPIDSQEPARDHPGTTPADESKPSQENSVHSEDMHSVSKSILIEAGNSLINEIPDLSGDTAAYIIAAIVSKKIKHIRIIENE